MVGKVGAVLQDMDLRPDQRAAVDSLLSEVDTKAEPVRAARMSLAQVLVDGIVAGKIDEARAQERIAGLKTAADAWRPAIETSMNKLHATLDATQREELIDLLRDRMMDGREGKRGKMKQLMQELKLTGDQKERIIAAVKAELGGDREQMRERFKQAKERSGELADAFVSDSFDARSLEVGKHAQHMALAGANRIMRVVQVALPLLTAEQRTKLAEVVQSRLDAFD
jgi:Spy/CpxP family protein refolding chaperone